MMTSICLYEKSGFGKKEAPVAIMELNQPLRI
jgi:hypothetical protein